MWIQKRFGLLMTGIVALILFFCSSLRHGLFQSNAWDLGIFDQAVYLISQGETPICSFLGFHILGDHAALIFYPLSLLYKIYPDVHWLLAVQAVALALGAIPTWYLSVQAGLNRTQAVTMIWVYWLYPLVFNVNLSDFHPEVIAMPAILGAVWAARRGNIGGFCGAIAVILSCKAILSLTVAAMGIWLLLEKRRISGAIAIVSGIAWFLITTQIIIPFYTGADAAVEMADSRYRYLGDTVLEIAQNLLLNPNLVFSKLFTLPNLEYLLLLLLPITWGSWRHLTPLIGAIPALGLNLITDYQPQKDLVHQYSLPILPFLLLSAIASLAAGDVWLRSQWIRLWSLVAFLAFAKFGYFGSLYLETLDTWQATREAVALVPPQGSVLTTSAIAPHLTHRPFVALATEETVELNQFEYILLNRRHPGWASSPEIMASLVERLAQSPWQQRYQRDDVFLFAKRQGMQGAGEAKS